MHITKAKVLGWLRSALLQRLFRSLRASDGKPDDPARHIDKRLGELEAAAVPMSTNEVLDMSRLFPDSWFVLIDLGEPEVRHWSQCEHYVQIFHFDDAASKFVAWCNGEHGPEEINISAEVFARWSALRWRHGTDGDYQRVTPTLF